MTNRRTFLTQAGLVSAGIMLEPCLFRALRTRPHGVGLQLWRMRDRIVNDHVKEVIEKVAKAGYKEVETYGYNLKDGFWGLDAKSFSNLLKSNSMSTPSGHFEFDS